MVILKACWLTVCSRKKRYVAPALLLLITLGLIGLSNSSLITRLLAIRVTPNPKPVPANRPISVGNNSNTNPQDTFLIDIHTLSPDIVLDIRYATRRNFTHEQLYSQPRCLLRSTVAKRLAQVQADLRQIGLGLKVYDCYRPLSVQKRMWELVPDDRYVANPTQGSRHNRGAAVDLTLVDTDGNELEMPSKFDDFSNSASANSKSLSPTARHNRQLLEKFMRKHGFTPIETEWWHFDAVDWQKFEIADVPFESVL